MGDQTGVVDTVYVAREIQLCVLDRFTAAGDGLGGWNVRERALCLDAPSQGVYAASSEKEALC